MISNTKTKMTLEQLRQLGEKYPWVVTMIATSLNLAPPALITKIESESLFVKDLALRLISYYYNL